MLAGEEDDVTWFPPNLFTAVQAPNLTTATVNVISASIAISFHIWIYNDNNESKIWRVCSKFKHTFSVESPQLQMKNKMQQNFVSWPKILIPSQTPPDRTSKVPLSSISVSVSELFVELLWELKSILNSCDLGDRAPSTLERPEAVKAAISAVHQYLQQSHHHHCNRHKQWSDYVLKYMIEEWIVEEMRSAYESHTEDLLLDHLFVCCSLFSTSHLTISWAP